MSAPVTTGGPGDFIDRPNDGNAVPSTLLFDDAMHSLQNIPGVYRVMVIADMLDGSRTFLQWHIDDPAKIAEVFESSARYYRNKAARQSAPPTA